MKTSKEYKQALKLASDIGDKLEKLSGLMSHLSEESKSKFSVVCYINVADEHLFGEANGIVTLLGKGDAIDDAIELIRSNYEEQKLDHLEQTLKDLITTDDEEDDQEDIMSEISELVERLNKILKKGGLK